MEKSFVARNLRKCISYKDLINNPALDVEYKRESISRSAALMINNAEIFNNSLRKIHIKSKPAYVVDMFDRELVIRLLSNNLKNTYKLSVKSREHIVRNLTSFLKESSPYNVHRFDVKSFYENIDRNHLYEKIKNDGFLSQVNLKLLKFLFSEFDERSISGLPRGLGISSVLTEIYLQKMDSSIREKDGIFLYERFVDDVILITDSNIVASKGESIVREFLPKGLCLHGRGGEKRYFGNVSSPKDRASRSCKHFSYLGYVFYSTEINSGIDDFLKIKRRLVKIDISKDKSKKIKSRIIKSLMSYAKSGKSSDDYGLLILRMKFLTGNYYLKNSSSIKDVKSGVYYNYRLINQSFVLAELDSFLRSILFYRGSRLSRRIQVSIPINRRREIANFSFKQGHENKKFYSFEPLDLVRIKRAWQ